MTHEFQPWLTMSTQDVTTQYGGSYAADAFARDADALPVIIPAFNGESNSLVWTLGSLAKASESGEKRVSPLVIINGPDKKKGAVERVCEDFKLEQGSQVVWSDTVGKVPALQTGVQMLLENEGHVGPFATVDDDVIVPISWPSAVVRHMTQGVQEAVSGGAIRYFGVEGVPSSVIRLRNIANAVLEVRAHRAGNVRAHGSNQWFKSGLDGIVKTVFADLDIRQGYGEDARIVDAMRSSGVSVLPMHIGTEGMIATAGDRSRSKRDLARTALGRGAERYESDESWRIGSQMPGLPS